MRNPFSRNNNRTFRPRRKLPKESHQYELHKQAKMTLGLGNYEDAVQLPHGEDINEWLAVNTVDFYNQINLLYGSITDYCTNESCPEMSAGPRFTYMWADGAKFKKPIKCSAPQYVDYLMTWVQSLLGDNNIFPTSVDDPFPSDFVRTVKNIFKRLFRIYAHIYYNHFGEIKEQGEEAHLNTCFKHFYYFTKEFSLIDRNQLEPLQEVITNLTSN
eukprot:TRINITY_DN1137_c0_g1_i2.p1 TRINITY_DN1137_c0_g1~~TRINITY_DN1137_c0_g1_i2.p1  ORF type:complete len:215 (+),score=39.85 TRINITY_DN1137_c0_g1_i2:51-695(+)